MRQKAYTELLYINLINLMINIYLKMLDGVEVKKSTQKDPLCHWCALDIELEMDKGVRHRCNYVYQPLILLKPLLYSKNGVRMFEGGTEPK